MSAKGRKSKDGKVYVPSKHDFYATPHWTIKLLLEQEEIRYLLDNPRKKLYVLEPCAGTGSLIEATMNNNPTLWEDSTLIELRPEEEKTLKELASKFHPSYQPQIICPQDYLTWTPDKRYDLIITNPPFSLAMEFLTKSLTEAPVVIYLLRLGFLGTKTRFPFWQKRRPDLYIMHRRPSFLAGGGTDQEYYAWFVFHPQESGKYKVI